MFLLPVVSMLAGWQDLGTEAGWAVPLVCQPGLPARCPALCPEAPPSLRLGQAQHPASITRSKLTVDHVPAVERVEGRKCALPQCSHWEARAQSHGPIQLQGKLGKVPSQNTGVLLIKKRSKDIGE